MNRHDIFYDILEQVDDNNRRCPDCGSVYCKYGIHSIKHRGYDVSIQCGDCDASETATSPKYDNIISNWHGNIISGVQ